MLATPLAHELVRDPLRLIARHRLTGLYAGYFDGGFAVAQADHQISVSGRRQLMAWQIIAGEGTAGRAEAQSKRKGAERAQAHLFLP
jgi:hypothetical protein